MVRPSQRDGCEGAPRAFLRRVPSCSTWQMGARRAQIFDLAASNHQIADPLCAFPPHAMRNLRIMGLGTYSARME